MSSSSSSTAYADNFANKLQKFTLGLLREPGLVCDQCLVNFGAVDGARFRCAQCRDFQLCAACHQVSKHQHQTGTEGHILESCWISLSNASRNPEEEEPPPARGAPFAARIEWALQRFSDRPCIGQRLGNSLSPTWWTFADIRRRVDACRGGLAKKMPTTLSPSSPQQRLCHCTPDPRPCVAIWGENSVDWIVADLACQLQHYLVVPLDKDMSVSDVTAILRDMPAAALFVDAARLRKATQLSREVAPCISIVMGAGASSDAVANILTMQELEKVAGAASPPIITQYARPECIVTITYTSGTTGSIPKGVLISDRGHAHKTEQASPLEAAGLRLASFLAFSNSTGRGQAMRCLCVGGALGLVRSAADFLTDIAWVQPTILTCPPVMWSALQSGHADDVRKIKAAAASSDQQQAAERVAFGWLRARLGGRVQSVAVGGAKSSPELVRFLKQCFGAAHAVDTYGATECGTIARDGCVLPGVTVRLIDTPGFYASDRPWPRGELCVHTPNMAAGYTAHALTDAAFVHLPSENGSEDDNGKSASRVFYRTGDVCELRRFGGKLWGQDDQIVVLARVSHMLKLSSGLFVSPEALEQVIETHIPGVQHAFLYAPIGADALVAILVPRPQHQAIGDGEEDEWMRLIRQCNLLPAYATPRRLWIDRTTSSLSSWLERGLLTSTHKKKRAALVDAYREQLDQLISAQLSSSSSSSSTTSLKQLAAEHLGVAINNIELLDTHTWLELGGDSMGAIAFSHRVGLRVTPTQLIGAPSLGRLLADAERERVSLLPNAAAAATAAADTDWESECTLPSDIVADIAVEKKSTETTTVLLSGATGFLGSFLLADLLGRVGGGIHIVCIVRAASPAVARERVISTLHRYGLCLDITTDNDDAFDRCVRIECGDMAQERFGLEQATYDQLITSVTHVIHNASRVNFVYPYAALRSDNVHSTLNVLRFCRHGPKTLCYVSTRSTRDCTLANIDGGAFSGYAQSKYVAEQLVLCAREKRGFTGAFITRPTSITGDSRTGYGPLDVTTDLMSALWVGLAQINPVHLVHATKSTSLREAATKETSQPLQLVGFNRSACLVPVDHVARTSVDLLLLSPTESSIVTLANPHGNTTWVKLLLLASSQAPIVSGEKARIAWRQLVESDRLPACLVPFRSLLLASSSLQHNNNNKNQDDEEEQKNPPPPNDLANILQYNQACPLVDDALLARCFRRLVEKKF